MHDCPMCKSNRIVAGQLVAYSKRTPAVFRPDSLKFLALTVAGGSALAKQSFACRDCGLVWNMADEAKLNRFLDKHCD